MLHHKWLHIYLRSGEPNMRNKRSLIQYQSKCLRKSTQRKRRHGRSSDCHEGTLL